MLDAFLLSLFPGKTLEELEDIDWPRLMRALEVKSIGNTEEVYGKFRQGLIQASSITAQQWQQIKEHDDLLNE